MLAGNPGPCQEELLSGGGRTGTRAGAWMGVRQISEGKITAQCWRVLTNTGSGQECWKSWPNLSIPKKALGVARPMLGGGWGAGGGVQGTALARAQRSGQHGWMGVLEGRGSGHWGNGQGTSTQLGGLQGTRESLEDSKRDLRRQQVCILEQALGPVCRLSWRSQEDH